LRVKEIADGKHPFAYEDEPATKARAVIRDLKLRILPIADANKKLLGIVTRTDIMAISSSISPITVKGIMVDSKYVASIDGDVVLTIKEMLRADAWHVPVTNSPEEKTYRGVLSLENYIEVMIKTSPEKFAKSVSEVMSTDIVTCTPEDEVEKIWRLMQTKGFAGLPVVKKNKLIGIVTQIDLLESGAVSPTFESSKGRFRASPKISSVMKTGIIAVKPSIKVIRVAKIMVFKGIGRIPVIDEEDRLLGIVDREDVARLLIK